MKTWFTLGPFLLVLFFPGLAACQSNLENEVLAALEEYVEATNSGDPDRLASLYFNSPVTGSVGDGTIFRSWSTISELIQGIYSQSGRVHLSGSGITITPLNRDAAVVYLEAEWVVGAGVSTTSRGAMTLVFIRTGDGWKVAHDHTSTLPGSTQISSLPMQPTAGPAGPVRATSGCEVTRIVDGDTIECSGIGRIRLIGMDTPESGQAPFGDMATDFLRGMIPEGTEVQIEPDVEAHDRYGRVLGYVWSGGVMVNWALVRAGYALLLTYPPNVQYVEFFQEAQTAAREAGVGLWEIDGFACPPSEFRRGNCG